MSTQMLEEIEQTSSDEGADHYCHPHIRGKTWCGIDYPFDEARGDSYVETDSVMCVVCMDLDSSVFWWEIQTIF